MFLPDQERPHRIPPTLRFPASYPIHLFAPARTITSPDGDVAEFRGEVQPPPLVKLPGKDYQPKPMPKPGICFLILCAVGAVLGGLIAMFDPNEQE